MKTREVLQFFYKLVPKNLHQQWQGEAAGQESYQTFSAPGFQNFLKLCLGARTQELAPKPPQKSALCGKSLFVYLSGEPSSLYDILICVSLSLNLRQVHFCW